MRTDDECYTGTGPAAEVVGQVRQTKHILASEQRPRDGLPRFRSSSDGRTISDEDFIFDALLHVGGDFKTDSVRLAYAQWVCNALNDADKLLLGSPEVAAAPQGQPTYTELLAQRDELLAEVERLKGENANLKTVMVAAAEEIHQHWDAHCDDEGYGPANLMRRLEEGIPTEYAYTAGDFARLKAENEALKKDAQRYRWLRNGCDGKNNEATRIASKCYGLEWDAAIDAAMTKEQP